MVFILSIIYLIRIKIIIITPQKLIITIIKSKKSPKLFFGIVTSQSSTDRRETMYNLWINPILKRGHDYVYCTERPIAPKYKWTPVKNWTKYYPKIKTKNFDSNRDRENKRVTMAEYFLKTDSDFFINPTDDVFVDASRINEFANELSSRYVTEVDLVLKGNCMLDIIHGGSGYVMTRAMARQFVKNAERWTRESKYPDDVEMNRFLGYLNMNFRNGSSPYMSGRSFQLFNGNISQFSACKKDYFDDRCYQPIYRLEDVYMMHPTGYKIRDNVKIWKNFLKLINDKSHHYGWYSDSSQLHEVCMFD